MKCCTGQMNSVYNSNNFSCLIAINIETSVIIFFLLMLTKFQAKCFAGVEKKLKQRIFICFARKWALRNDGIEINSFRCSFTFVSNLCKLI